MICASFTAPITPESEDSNEKGTNIFPSGFSGLRKSVSLIENDQGPFKFSHSFLSNWGLGYSGHIFSGSNFAAHFVLILSPFGAQSHFSSPWRRDLNPFSFEFDLEDINKIIKMIRKEATINNEKDNLIHFGFFSFFWFKITFKEFSLFSILNHNIFFV